jgi:hypothetical protein
MSISKDQKGKPKPHYANSLILLAWKECNNCCRRRVIIVDAAQ